MPTDQYQEVDEHGKPTGRLVDRKLAHTQRVLHRVAGVMLVDSKGRYVVQRRQPKPGHWYYDSSAAGHVDLGETPLQTVLRETEEELNIKLPPDVLTLLSDDFIADDEYPELGIHARHMITAYVAMLPEDWQFVPNDEVPAVVRLTLNELRVLCSKHPEACLNGLLAAVQLLN